MGASLPRASRVRITDAANYFTGTEVEAALQELGADVGSQAAADYLVGTAQAGLSAEIVVGTSPGGELGGTWASPTVDASHSGSTHASVQAAAEATAAAALTTHEADTTAVHGIADTSTLYRSGGTDVAVADGGTGSSTAAGARTSLDVPSNAEAVLDTLVDAKGDLLTASAADTPARLAVGAITAGLIPDSAEATGLKWVPRLVCRSSDSAGLNTQTTPQADSQLLWSIAANEQWFFQAFLLLNCANTTMDMKFGWTYPASCTMQWGAIAGGNVNSFSGYGFTGVGNTALRVLTEVDTLATASASAQTTGVNLAGFVKNSSTAGSVNLAWAQNTSNGSDLIMKEGSIILLWRIA